MEAEVGTPIEYNPEEFINKSSNNFDEPDEPDVDERILSTTPTTTCLLYPTTSTGGKE